MSTLAADTDRVPQRGGFVLGLVAGGAFALTTDVPAAAVMAVFAVVFVLYQYHQQ